MSEKEQIAIIVKDEPFFSDEDGELFYNLGKDSAEGAEICRKVLQTIMNTDR